jgi:NAD(P)-dependent dehydrogenase (short-subunit alcohol dehydrogenase family)
MPKTSFRSIDLDPNTPAADQAQQLWVELAQPNQPYQSSYGWRDGERTALSVKAIDLNTSNALVFDRASVVVFAGGARGIGAVCAKALAAQTGCTIVFLGRTPLTSEIWELSRLSESELKQKADAFAKAFKAANPGCPPRAPREAWKKKQQALEAIETLNSLKNNGSDADYFAVDVRDRAALLQAFQDIQRRFQRIDVVVHVAGLGGVDTDRMLLRKDWETIHQVLETKVIGALHILKAAEATGVKLFLGFGSIASRFGNTGQVDYAAANGLLTGLARAHNATGKLPTARVLAWGAWDGVGMAVSGPTKEMLLAYGLKFIAPDQGAACFLTELTASPATPAELYLTPKWSALTDLLDQQAQGLTETAPKTTLLGTVVQHRSHDYLKAEHRLESHAIPFLDHHRYDGTAWVPAVMGVEVAVEAAASLFPDLQAIAVQQLTLKKAVRLVRDEPVELITEVRALPNGASEQQVHAIVSARFKGREWVFAEMTVLMAQSPAQYKISGNAVPNQALNEGESTYQSHSDLYPSEWLRYHAHGQTFQVLDSLTLQCDVGQAQGRMIQTMPLKDYYTPLTLIDGGFQAYSCLVSTAQKSWSGPPLRIGEIRWLPESLNLARAHFDIQIQPDVPSNSTVQLFDAQGHCLLRIQDLDFGGTSLSTSTPSRSPASAIATPYLGNILSVVPGQTLYAEQRLDAEAEVMLSDHKFPFLNTLSVFVPAVYFLEVAVEAAAYLNPQAPPVEVQNFHVHRALNFLKEPPTLMIEAEGVAPGKTHVRMSTRKGDKVMLHAEAWVIHGSFSPLPRFIPPELTVQEVRPKEMLYPFRFPNGFVFQVIDEMVLGEGHRSRSQLQLTKALKPGHWLPASLLDGAFQVDSATRSGFNRHSGLPKTFASLRWVPQVNQLSSVQCFSSTGSEATDSPGDLYFLDEDQNVVLHMHGIILTPVIPVRGRR